jgi:hypothetical protein
MNLIEISRFAKLTEMDFSRNPNRGATIPQVSYPIRKPPLTSSTVPVM